MRRKNAARLEQLLSGEVKWTSTDAASQKMMRELTDEEKASYKAMRGADQEKSGIVGASTSWQR